MKTDPHVSRKLKACEPEIRMFFEELKKENQSLHKQLARLRAKVLSQQNEITALKKIQPKQPKIIFQSPPPRDKRSV